MTAMTPWTSENRGWMADFRREMDEMVHRFFGNGAVEEGRQANLAAWAPRVDVEETDKEIVVKADLPGVKPEQVEISASDGILVIKGERKEQREDKQKDYHTVERFAGQFFRSIPLPPGTDKEKITAASTDGVVTIKVPKTAQAQPKKIAVVSGK